MTPNKPRSLCRAAVGLALLCATCGAARATATIVIVNENAAGIGFNDPAPVAPIGGNTGSTLGQQRLIAFQHAADIWGANLSSRVTIRVGASFVPLACDADSAILGSAGANDIFTDFPNAPRSNTWYPGALASKLAGSDQTAPDEPHIRARFNSRLGLFSDCLAGSPFYLGLDKQPGTAIDLVTVLLHELAHGLGFQSFTDEETGEFFDGLPAIWDHYLIDNASNTLWTDMTNAQRRQSAISGERLSWNGARVTAAAAGVLAHRASLAVGGPAAGAAAGNYLVGDADFGPPLGPRALSGQLMPVVDQSNGNGLACTPLGAADALAVQGRVALVDRGVCTFTVKALNVQNAGAIGMVVADNAPGEVSGLGGSDERIVIPAVRVSQADGATLKAALLRRSRTASGVVASLRLDPVRLAGADGANRIRMYSPSTYSPGSSVSHYTTDAKPNQLMEPALNADLSHTVKPPLDLTLPLLHDIGW